jgi:phage baseplate assembly protein W
MDGADLAPREFLGVGWSWPVEATGDGDIALARYEESVRQSVWIILGTSPGERVMRPDFGCGLQDLVFSVGNATTEGLVADEVRRSLTQWEPRLDLIEVQVANDPARPEALIVRITYRVRATNNVFNLVYPFYLEQEA